MHARVYIFLMVILAACVAEPVNKPVGNSSAAPAKPAATAAPTELAPAPSAASDYPDLGLAPEISGDIWLNTAEPLRLSSLQGSVVLVDMWTFG